MKFSIFILVFILKDFIFCRKGSFLQYFPNSKTWFEAQNYCLRHDGRLANGGDVQRGIQCNKEPHAHDIVNGTSFWVGEHWGLSDWISRTGYYQISKKVNYTYTTASLFKCSERCRSSNSNIVLFLHKDRQCVCLSTTNNQLILINGSNFDPSRSYWLYFVNKTIEYEGTGNCVELDCSNDQIKLYAANCLDKRKSFCDFDSTNFFSTWLESQQRCNSTVIDSYPEMCRRDRFDQLKGIWLTTHRFELYSKIKNDKISEKRYVRNCTSILYHDEDTSPKVNVNCSSMTDGFFCVIHNRKQIDTTKNAPTHFCIQGAANTTVTSKTLQREITSSNRSSLLLVIIVASSVFIVLLFIVGLIVCKRRKLWNSKSNSANQKANQESSEYQDSQSTRKSRATLFSNHLYCDEFELNSPHPPQSSKGISICESAGDVKHQSEHSNLKQNSCCQTNSNDEYNQLDQHRKNCINDKANNIYHSSIGTRVKSDSIVNATRLDSDIIKKPVAIDAVQTSCNQIDHENEYDQLQLHRTNNNADTTSNIYNSSLGFRDESDPTYNVSSRV